MEEEHLNDRLIQLRKSLNMNQGEFATHINISQGALSLLENRKTNLSLDSLESIIRVTQVNPQWLLSGEGAMFESSNPNDDNSITIVKDHLIPLISLEAHAGYLKGSYHHEEYKNTLDYFKVPGFLDSKYRMFQVEGDSMKHLLYPEDIVITEQKNIQQLKDGQLYIVITSHEIVAKRIYTEQNKNQLVLRSENPNYKSYILTKDEIVEVWSIKGKVSKNLTGIDSTYGERIATLEESLSNLKYQIDSLLKET